MTIDRFAGWAVPGVSFASGHVLALRCFPSSSIGPGYRSLWHRDPDGRWTFYASAPPSQSCARYFGRDVARTVVTPVDVTWRDGRTFDVRVPAGIDWQVGVAATLVTRASGRLLPWLPGAAWKSRRLLRLLGRTAGWLLGTGPLVLSGETPNGHLFTARPRRIWLVADSAARVGGLDLGPTAPLPVPATLGDMLVPRRGLVMAGDVLLAPPRSRSGRVSPLGVPCHD